jgi:DNA adenine methylase
MKPAPSILRRPGGKALLCKYILPLIKPHKCFVEVFAGGAALLRAKEKSTMEVLNDTDEVIVNAFRCVRFHADAVAKELENTINSRADFIIYREQKGITDIQRAARWLYLNALSFGGDSDSFGVQRKSQRGGAANSLINLRARILEVQKRLERVIVEKLDWRKCLKTYDSDETLFFCDPPYPGGKIRSYASWMQKDIQEFAEAIQKVQADWIVTVNDSPANRKLFVFGKQKRIQRSRMIANKSSDARVQFGELIVTKIK